MWLWIALAAPAFGGILALFFGLRGRRIDGHPLCRKCRYDLSGTEAVPVKCPECGRALAGEPRALRIGNRKRRPMVLGIGAVVTLLSISAAGLYAYNQSRNFDWNTIKPVWWLKSEAAGSGMNAPAARRELLARIEREELPNDEASEIAEIGLTMQADPDIPWNQTWGEIIELLWEREQLSEDQIARYVQNAFSADFEVDARRVIRQGAELPLREGVHMKEKGDGFRLSMPRLTFRQPTTLTVIYRIKSIERGDSLILGPQQWTDHPISQAGFHRYPSLPLNLPPGELELEVTYECTAYSHPQNVRPVHYPDGPRLDADPIAQWEMKRLVPVTVLDDDSSATMIADASRAPAVRDSIVQIEFILTTIQQPGGGGTFGGRNGMIIIDSPPMDLSFDVFARVGGEEKQIGSIAARAAEAGPQNAQQIVHHPRDLFPNALTCDLVLRASPTAAERTIDIFEVWDGEIIIEDVPIRAAESIEQQ